jgi:aspartyl protease family protein
MMRRKKGPFMRTEIIAAAVIVAGAIFSARFLDHASDEVQAQEALAASANIATATPAQTYWGDEVRITAAPDHQYYVNAEVNRRAARFLVDTGASFVALRDSDARNAGIFTSYADFSYPVKTANGETKAALVTIDEIEIDGLRVEGVKAFILQDDQLGINLLGMSFLSRLESVEARGGELVLRG